MNPMNARRIAKMRHSLARSQQVQAERGVARDAAEYAERIARLEAADPETLEGFDRVELSMYRLKQGAVSSLASFARVFFGEEVS